MRYRPGCSGSVEITGSSPVCSTRTGKSEPSWFGFCRFRPAKPHSVESGSGIWLFFEREPPSRQGFGCLLRAGAVRSGIGRSFAFGYCAFCPASFGKFEPSGRRFCRSCAQLRAPNPGGEGFAVRTRWRASRDLRGKAANLDGSACGFQLRNLPGCDKMRLANRVAGRAGSGGHVLPHGRSPLSADREGRQ